MKAIRVSEYGGPSVLKLEEIPAPQPGQGQPNHGQPGQMHGNRLGRSLPGGRQQHGRSGDISEIVEAGDYHIFGPFDATAQLAAGANIDGFQLAHSATPSYE